MSKAEFRTYDKEGRVLLDANKATFCLIKSGRLKRLVEETYESTRTEFKTQRFGRWGNKHHVRFTETPHYCVYYIEIPSTSISPIPLVHYESGIENVATIPVLGFLSTGIVGNVKRIYFYSNGRLTDTELNSFRIYVFDSKPVKEDKVGINLYDRKGNITFSSKTYPLNLTAEEVTIYSNSYVGYWTYDPKQVANVPKYNGLAFNYKGNMTSPKSNRGDIDHLIKSLDRVKRYATTTENVVVIPKAYVKQMDEAGKPFPPSLVNTAAVYNFFGSIGGVSFSRTIPYSEVSLDSQKKPLRSFEVHYDDEIDDGMVDILNIPKDVVFNIKYMDVTHLPFPFN